MKPKLEAIIRKYKEMEGIYINIDELKRIAAHYGIFTAPALILYIEGKESIREARHISIDEFEKKLDRYYKMLKD